MEDGHDCEARRAVGPKGKLNLSNTTMRSATRNGVRLARWILEHRVRYAEGLYPTNRLAHRRVIVAGSGGGHRRCGVGRSSKGLCTTCPPVVGGETRLRGEERSGVERARAVRHTDERFRTKGPATRQLPYGAPGTSHTGTSDRHLLWSGGLSSLPGGQAIRKSTRSRRRTRRSVAFRRSSRNSSTDWCTRSA